MKACRSGELSNKVFKGQCRLIQLGYRQGGPAGYGLRRMLIDQSGEAKGLLALGEKKSIQTDRVILVPGPAEEVENVRWIYHLFVTERRNEGEIAKLLNERGIKTDLGREWNRGAVHEVLTNEKSIGNNIFNRVSFKLKKKRVVNPADMWIKAEPLSLVWGALGTEHRRGGRFKAGGQRTNANKKLNGETDKG